MLRLTCFVLLAAACSCSRPVSNPPTQPPVELSCDTSVARYCAADGRECTLAGAERDSDLCPATITRCGSTTVIAKNSVDISTLFYYQGGQLVAVVNQRFPGPQYICLAGPERFVVPTCDGPSQNLPVCRH